MSIDRHGTASEWIFPPRGRAPLANAGGLQPLVERTNLLELAARPDRFEHHLLVVGRLGVAQLELVVASEPLCFAHRNISDEFVLPLRTGDPVVDGMQFMTMLSGHDLGEDVGRIRNRAGQMILHPDGYLHWPGRLRPPFDLPPIPVGHRRAGVSLVYCASSPTPPSPPPEGVWGTDVGSDTKAYCDPPPPLVSRDLLCSEPGWIAAIGSTKLELVVDPTSIKPAHGGLVVIILGNGGRLFDGDLVRIAPGGSLDATGVLRCLLLTGLDTVPAPAPASWVSVPPPPFAVFEDGPRGELPFRYGSLLVSMRDERSVSVQIGSAEPTLVPRHWLARMLFRLALHGYQLGYVETYGKFFYDDRTGFRLGYRSGRATADIELSRPEVASLTESLYRCVAPSGYVERIG